MVEFETLKKGYQTVVVGYFPFKDMHTPEGYRVFAAAGMMLMTGTPEDDSTCFVVVTRNELAHQLGMRFEGDIQLYISEGHVYSWSFTKTKTAENVAEWVREKRAEVAPVRWIHFNRNTELMTSQFWHLLNKSSVLLLITPLGRIYRSQPDVTLFSELAKEYCNCEQESILRMNHDSVTSSPPSPHDELLNDKQACSEATEGIVKVSKQEGIYSEIIADYL
ncbi:unnamed protein product [Cylicostephanus goldi]|uniref:Uncharacterized protein n=1 Tax=Cylicostephanus goldi TaxID=71465 RepID=A0A3P6RZA8_CYLGO|nr:unnamed protein product [Cylicostephanus goldi]